MKALSPWVMMPSKWIAEGRLKHFTWVPPAGANNTAALMVFAPILHQMDKENGISRITYSALQEATSLCRTTISAGLKVLETESLIEREVMGRSTYKICNFNPSEGWAKFPAQRLYRDSQILFFNELHLRQRAELDALKLWYFIAARRDNSVNLAKVTYEQITEGTGIVRDKIKTALSLLTANGMVHVEHVPSRVSDHGFANAYRLPQIDSTNHMGNMGRTFRDFDDAFS